MESELLLYVRGDSGRDARRQADLHRCSGDEPDLALRSNRRRIAALLDRMLDHVGKRQNAGVNGT